MGQDRKTPPGPRPRHPGPGTEPQSGLVKTETPDLERGPGSRGGPRRKMGHGQKPPQGPGTPVPGPDDDEDGTWNATIPDEGGGTWNTTTPDGDAA